MRMYNCYDEINMLQFKTFLLKHIALTSNYTAMVNKLVSAQSTGAAEYTNCISAEE